MKITNKQLKQIIREEMEDMPQNKLSTDVTRAADRIDKSPNLDKLLQKINTAQELEQLLVVVIKKVRVDPNLMKTAFMKAAKTLAASGKE